MSFFQSFEFFLAGSRIATNILLMNNIDEKKFIFEFFLAGSRIATPIKTLPMSLWKFTLFEFFLAGSRIATITFFYFIIVPNIF